MSTRSDTIVDTIAALVLLAITSPVFAIMAGFCTRLYRWAAG